MSRIPLHNCKRIQNVLPVVLLVVGHWPPCNASWCPGPRSCTNNGCFVRPTPDLGCPHSTRLVIDVVNASEAIAEIPPREQEILAIKDQPMAQRNRNWETKLWWEEGYVDCHSRSATVQSPAKLWPTRNVRTDWER